MKLSGKGGRILVNGESLPVQSWQMDVEASMDHKQWRSSQDPEPMLEYVLGVFRKADDGPEFTRPAAWLLRKLRLFACACCRAAWPLLHDEARAVVELAEAETGEEALMPDAKTIKLVKSLESPLHRATRHAVHAASSARMWASNARSCSLSVLRHVEQLGVTRAQQADLLREIVGDPFRPVTFTTYDGPLWRATDDQRADVFAVARAAYEQRQLDGTLDPLRLSILADALEDASCTDDAILSHLRGSGPHVRGCWALDLILGKE